MPTTTNFGWTTPADTDLVKDGASAIRTLGNGIDTSFLDLKGGTTGQVLSKNTNTDLDFTWTTIATGGMTLISTTTLSGASVTLSSIPATYNDLRLVIRLPLPVNDGASLRIRVNGDSGSNRHKSLYYSGISASSSSFDDTSFKFIDIQDNSVTNALSIITFPDYTNATTWKLANITSTSNDNTTATTPWFYTGIGAYNQTSAISSLVILASGGFTSGTAELYGVK